MHQRDAASLRHQQARWLRPDAYRWVRPDAARFVAPGSNVADALPALSSKYNPNQPRVPAGNPDGGQWTDGGSGSAAPMGDIGFGNLSELGDFSDLFQITPARRTSTACNSPAIRRKGSATTRDRRWMSLRKFHSSGPRLEASGSTLCARGRLKCGG